MVKCQKCGAPRLEIFARGLADREQRLKQFFSYPVAPVGGGTMRTSTRKLKKTLKKKGKTKEKIENIFYKALRKIHGFYWDNQKFSPRLASLASG